MTNTQPDPTLNRWRTARRITLSAIVLAGTMATAGALAQRLATASPCSLIGAGHDQTPAAQAPKVASYYTYPGIGVELAQEGDSFVVQQVFADTPSDGKLFPGATLVSVDGESPETMQGWTSRIRGPKGSAVELEVEYPCSGHDTVTLERDLIRLAY